MAQVQIYQKGLWGSSEEQSVRHLLRSHIMSPTLKKVSKAVSSKEAIQLEHDHAAHK